MASASGVKSVGRRYLYGAAPDGDGGARAGFRGADSTARGCRVSGGGLNVVVDPLREAAVTISTKVFSAAFRMCTGGLVDGAVVGGRGGGYSGSGGVWAGFWVSVACFHKCIWDKKGIWLSSAAARSIGRPAAAGGSAAAMGAQRCRRRGGSSQGRFAPGGGGEVANTPPRRVGTSPRGPRAAHLCEAPVLCAAGGEGRFPQETLACGIWPHKSSEGI